MVGESLSQRSEGGVDGVAGSVDTGSGARKSFAAKIEAIKTTMAAQTATGRWMKG